MGTLHDQCFYAIRANGAAISFPFSAQPFTALVDISHSVDEAVLKTYAEALIKHGCVQAVCRGEEADRLVGIFDELADDYRPGKNSPPFTSMCLDDEPLNDAIQYFVLPCGLAQTGLFVVIGDSGDFHNAIKEFSTMAGAVREDIGEAVFEEEDLVCFR